MLHMNDMNIDTKIIDKILGLLIIVELVFSAWLIFPSFKLFVDMYEGFPLIIMIARIILYFSLGILTVIQLFRNASCAKWLFLFYVAYAVVMKFWRIAPNSDKYMAMLRKFQGAVAQGSVEVTTSTNVFTYPAWWTFVLYFTALLYLFIIRQRPKIKTV